MSGQGARPEARRLPRPRRPSPPPPTPNPRLQPPTSDRGILPYPARDVRVQQGRIFIRLAKKKDASPTLTRRRYGFPDGLSVGYAPFCTHALSPCLTSRPQHSHRSGPFLSHFHPSVFPAPPQPLIPPHLGLIFYYRLFLLRSSPGVASTLTAPRLLTSLPPMLQFSDEAT